jgi:serine/threonine protein kinase/tetratricopeptide (TPR) repeat protein
MPANISHKTCETCGSSVDLEAPSGFCPACLLQTALNPDGEEAESTGAHLTDFELLEEVARGGMGIVYRARQHLPPRVVALKMILPGHVNSSGAIARFRAEAEAAAALDHEGILPIYAVGEKDGAPFYSMKFADGGSLSTRLAEFQGQPQKAAKLVAAIARAVEHAHKHGILHRDLKPGNVLFDGADKPFVSDFGLAKWLEREADLTQTLAVLGTPYYMAPEQAAGEHALTSAPDIYSLGAILFDLLTGRPPFRGDNPMEVLRNAAERPAPRPRSISRHIPADLETICLKCLEKNPGARYASAAALAEDLERFCAGRIILARRAGVVIHGRRWIGRNRVVVALGTVASALLISLLLVVVGRVGAPALAKSIAVLPFEDLSGEGENANFVGGIQDDVVTNLAKISQLKVISRSSVLTYKATPHNVREIAKTLGVGTVLEGSVRRAGNRVRVNVQLITAATDEQIWAEAYERDMTDVFAIQSDLALQIASKLKANLSSAQKARLQRKPTHSGEAYLFYIEANDIGARYGAFQDDLKKAEQLYEKAIQLDPSFALAFAQLSHVEIQLNEIYDPTPARYEKAVNCAKQALRLQPDLPEAHMAMGVSYAKEDWSAPAVDAEKAMTEFTIALRGSPNDANILTAIGRIERHQGKWAESTAHLEKAAALDPNNVERWHRLFFNHEITRNFAAAWEALDRVLALQPDSWYYYSHQAHLQYFWKGDLSLVEKMLSRPRSGTGPEGFYTTGLYGCYKLLRRYDEAERVLLEDPQENFNRNGLWPIPKSLMLGHVYEWKGDRARAQACFEAARPAIERTIQARPLDAGWRMVAAELYAGLGRKEDAIREAKRATEIVPEATDKSMGVGLLEQLARTYLEVGEPDLAIPILAHSLQIPAGIYRNELRIDPAFDQVRGDPRFQEMMAHPDVVFPLNTDVLPKREP